MFFDVYLKVVAKNTLGVLNTISNKIAENKIDITFLSLDKNQKNLDVIQPHTLSTYLLYKHEITINKIVVTTNESNTLVL